MTLDPALVSQFSDRKWRLNNLYFITDKRANVSKFKLNAAQEKLLDELHYLNIILKARQLGFSTLILLMALDAALFNSNYSAGLVADTLDNAKALLGRIKFAYERLPDTLRARIAISVDNKEEIEFSNGSSVRVGTSLRSGTYNLLHVSEYGKICAKFPDKANEIKSGALNTIAPRQLVFIESTAEGRAGDFFEKATAAEKLRDAGIEPGEMDYKFHFFPWMDDPAYTSSVDVPFSDEDQAYFVALANKGIKLTQGQKNWYSAKRREQGADMFKEFPSTPDEAFKAVRDGAYWAKDLQKLRQLKNIGKFGIVPGLPVHTAWDLGIHDYTSIWLFQVIEGRTRFLHYMQDTNEGLAYYFNYLDRWLNLRSGTWGTHLGPHDMENKQNSDTGEIITRTKIAAKLGWRFEIVQRSPNKANSIENVRTKLPACEFDEDGTAKGLLVIENYTKEWDDRMGVWRDRPRHDENSHGADALQTWADGAHKIETEVFVDPWGSAKHQRMSYA